MVDIQRGEAVSSVSVRKRVAKARDSRWERGAEGLREEDREPWATKNTRLDAQGVTQLRGIQAMVRKHPRRNTLRERA